MRGSRLVGLCHAFPCHGSPSRPCRSKFTSPQAPSSSPCPPQEKAQKDAGLVPGTSAPGTDANKEEADSRSVYVGSVDYAATPEELQSHFQGCGTVNRVTILSDKAGNPKGFAYIEFLEADAVSAACLLDGSELRGRTLKVNPKRTNVPGMRARGRGRGRGGAGGYMMPPPFMMPWMWGGYMPRGRGRGRGRGGYTPY